MSFISDNFVSSTGQDLIQNSKHLNKKKYNCIRPLAFKSYRYRVGYQSNKKLYAKRSPQFINSILKYSRF